MASDRIACICPTSWRPWLVANALACFRAQRDCPYERRLFIVADDECSYAQCGDDYEVITLHARSLAEKYNYGLEHALRWGATIIAVWEDDDIYLPWHLVASVTAMARERRMWSHASRVWSLYTGELRQEPAAGRFHGQTVFRVLPNGAPRWPDTARADYDQQMLARLDAMYGDAADPLRHGYQPSYVFRWSSTHTPHAQHYMTSPDDESWYARAWLASRDEWQRRGRPAFTDAQMDDETRSIIELLTLRNG